MWFSPTRARADGVRHLGEFGSRLEKISQRACTLSGGTFKQVLCTDSLAHLFGPRCMMYPPMSSGSNYTPRAEVGHPPSCGKRAWSAHRTLLACCHTDVCLSRPKDASIPRSNDPVTDLLRCRTKVPGYTGIGAYPAQQVRPCQPCTVSP